MTKEQLQKGKGISESISSIQKDLEHLKFMKERKFGVEIKKTTDSSFYIPYEECSQFLNKIIKLREHKISELEKQFNDL